MNKPYRRSAGIVLVRSDGPDVHWLLLRCYRYWDFPKGEIEPDEHPLDAAQREVAEETGLTDLCFRWGTHFIETAPYGQGKVARYYLAEAVSGEVVLGVNPALGMPEHHEFRWVGTREARRLLNDRVRAVLEWAALRIANPETAPPPDRPPALLP
jgi:bis(5'-nucleosidyl)-tetraphosphatase